ncbi:MAG TPA: efflux RND transporter periplasmic adaptor subunit [Gemmatimonadaceae bacterium]|nr:efflux RND transporter periplasmic adaptor subunit [Gemmatimonadaceae bacterium]
MTRGSAARKEKPATVTPLRLPELDPAAVPVRGVVTRSVTLLFSLGFVLVAGLGVAAFRVAVDRTVDGSGSLEPVTVWPVRARETGVVAQVFVGPGDTVSRGQVLIRMDTATTDAALAELKAARNAARVDSEAAERQRPVVEEERTERLAEADAGIAHARATLRERMVTYGMGTNADSMMHAYVPGRFVIIDEALADVHTAEAQRAYAATQLARAGAEALDARKRGFDIQRLEEQMRNAETQRAHLALAAPADGVILTEQVERLTGAAVRQGDPLLEIADLSHWRARLILTERAVHDVRIGDAVSLAIPALKVLEGDRLRGRVAAVSDQPIDTSAVTAKSGYRVLVVLDRAQLARLGVDQFRRGYQVQARIVTRTGTIAELIRAYLAERVRGSS